MLRLRTLGGLSVDLINADDGAATRRRPLALLALLAVAGQRGLSRDKIVAYLWPESDDERARNSLSQALTALKREFGVDQLVVGSTELRLNAELISSDVQEFGQLLDDGETRRAVDLYGGPFLDGVFLKGASEFERWVERERDRLHRRYLTALDRLGDQALTSGDLVAVVRWRRERALADPLDAGAALALMQAQAAAGDSAGALQHFRAHAERLKNELGIEPEAHVSSFAASLRTGAGVMADVREFAPNAILPSDLPAAAVAAVRPFAPVAPVAARRTSRRELRWWFLAGGAIAVALLVGTTALRDRSDARLALADIKPLTRSPDSLEVDASISPNGQYVAYASGRPGRYRLYVRQVSQSAAVPIATGVPGNQRSPRWTPDGVSIVFSADGKIYEAPHLGGAARLLVESGANPALSPDGKRIAYSGGDGIWIAPRDSGQAVQIDTGHHANSPAWSPDGKRIAYVRGTMQYAAFGFAPGSIWIVDADGKNRRPVTTEEHLNTSPVWEPDGRAILFVSDRDGTRDIYRQRIDGGDALLNVAEPVTTGAEVYNFTVSRDGSRVAYSTLRQGNHIWMAPITDGITPLDSAHPVTSDAQKTEGVAISHDGKWIAFDSDRDGPRQHLFKMAFDGKRAVGDPIQLTRGAYDDFSPRWSPDDSEIVFHRIVGGYRDVFVVGSDGRGEQRVTADTGQYYDPDWSPDGQHVVLSSHRAPEKMKRKGPQRNDAVIVTRNRDRSWSGRRVVNDATTPAGAVIRWSPKGEQLLMSGLVLLPVEGGAVRPIGDPKRKEARGSVVVWGQDGRTVYVWHTDSAKIKTIWSVNISTGNPRPLMRFEDPLKQPFGNRFDTDGKRLFFVMRSDEADVFSAELRRGAGTGKP